MITKVNAIVSLRPKSDFVIVDDVIVDWSDNMQSPPTENEIDAELVRLQAEYDAKEYQRKRAKEYPSLADFADAYYWMQKGQTDLMDEYVAKCDAVKNKFPKETT